MPQFEPFTLVLQWNSTVIVISFTVFILGCYILPLMSKLYMARKHISI